MRKQMKVKVDLIEDRMRVKEKVEMMTKAIKMG